MLYGGEEEGLHNLCANGQAVKWNVNEGSNECKSLLYEGGCDCRISSLKWHRLPTTYETGHTTLELSRKGFSGPNLCTSCFECVLDNY